MIVGVTALGSATGDAAAAATQIVRYLEGRSPADAGRDPGPTPDLPGVEGTEGIEGYYADSMASPGIWMGRGLTGVRPEGIIDPDQLHRVLLGQHPVTGEQLLGANGSAGRAHPEAVAAGLRGPDEKELSLPEAADILGVSASYLRAQATATTRARATQARQAAAGEELDELPSSYLDATQAAKGSRWKVTRGELRRFAAEREAPAVVVGYDLTFSAPKSVSILWATATPAQQVGIEAALTDSVRVGIDYLQAHASHVRVSVRDDDGRHLERQAATGLLGAAYLHETSRALDPQLHFHVVAANMAEGPDGVVRALDGRSLYLHAKTAGYLAAAELRHRLATDLGVAWEPVHRGVADIAGVSRAAVIEMSQRARAMDAHIEAMAEHQPTTARGRQIAAYDTRAAKEAPVDPDALRPSWERRLEGVGFDRQAIDACYDRQPGPATIGADDRAELMALMSSPEGVTEFAATFDRRDVLQFVAQWGGDRLAAAAVGDLADAWLAGPDIIGLRPDTRDARTADVIRLADGRTVAAIEGETIYTTTQMLRVESQITSAYARARHAGIAPVPSETLDAVLATRGHLGEDQVAMVRSITTSPQRIQCVYGPAGSGKTTALEAAARAWEASGYAVVGAAVQGTASEIVGDKAAIDNATVASVLWRVAGGDATLGPRCVVLVDECSALGNRDLAQLAAASEEQGFVLRLVGDPAQHTAVAAGGAWRQLLARHPEDRAELSEVRRQKGAEMADVREALSAWRAGDVDTAINRLDRAGRVFIGRDRDHLLSTVVDDWYGDRQRRSADPSLEESSMTTERHRDRRELNELARARLLADGTLAGPELEAGELRFAVGDEVIALRQDRLLRPDGPQRRGNFVHTGERGVVVAVRLGSDEASGSLRVDFARRGEVEVGMEYLTRRLENGVVGGLAHSYALTSHAAQGETYEAARPIATDASSAKGLYVGATRGEHDLRIYAVLERNFDPIPNPDPHLPRLDPQTTTLEAVVAQVASDREELLATEVDPDAAQVAHLRRSHSMAELARMGASSQPDAALATRALEQEERALAVAARLAPPVGLVGRLGPRPHGWPQRESWDRAVGAVAVYRARYAASPVPEGPFATWALGPRPSADGPGLDDYQRAAEALGAAEISSLVARPPARLAAERAHIRAALSAPSPQRTEALEAAYHDATRAAQEAEARYESAVEAVGVDGGRGRRGRRSSAQRADAVSSAQAERSAAADALRGATEGLKAARAANTQAADSLTVRLSRINRAIAVRVGEAVASPAPYLHTALGPRPAGGPERAAWNEAATKLETWRHAELGLAPADGPLDDAGLAAAIGATSDSPAQALRHGRLVEELSRDLTPAHSAAPSLDRNLDGPDLSL